jgi:hypothetical protein
MNKSKCLILGVLFIVVSQAGPAAATSCPAPILRTQGLPYHVTDVKQEGVSLPDNPIQKTWKYNISWKPARHPQTGALVKTYKVGGNNCSGHTYTCTDARCNAEISGCVASTSWVGITVDIPGVSGVRLSPILKPGYPCD